jgi:hypothetical protein
VRERGSLPKAALARLVNSAHRYSQIERGGQSGVDVIEALAKALSIRLRGLRSIRARANCRSDGQSPEAVEACWRYTLASIDDQGKHRGNTRSVLVPSFLYLMAQQ